MIYDFFMKCYKKIYFKKQIINMTYAGKTFHVPLLFAFIKIFQFDKIFIISLILTKESLVEC